MRKAGILLPVSSLPSPYGIGTFSKEAYEFVDLLKEAGQSCWQILPMGPTGYGDSPYQSFSAFAGNPYLIDLEQLIQDGLLTREECGQEDFGRDESRIDYGKLYSARPKILHKAFERWKSAYKDPDAIKECLEAELEEERTKLQEKEAELEERENAIAEQESINDEEKAKYALSMKNLTGEIARLQARLGQGSAAKEDSGEVAKLKSRLNSVTKARASMEKTLNNENNELRRKNKELSDLLLEKTQETDKLKEDVHDQAVHLFDSEKAEYLKKIEDLQKIADIAGEEMSPERCEKMLNEDGVYGDVSILHGARNDIVSCSYSENFSVKVVFGPIPFADVCKKLKRVDTKSLSKLNDEVADVKFFTKEDGVYARKYINRRITEEELRSVLSELIGYFDDDKKRR